MTPSVADLKHMEGLVAPIGERLKVVPPGQVPRLVDGIYVIVRSTGKWVISIYRNVKNSENETEIAIDIGALVWPRVEERDRASAWLEAQRISLEKSPSGIHAIQPEDAFRIGLTLDGTWTFLERLRAQIVERSPHARWPMADSSFTPEVAAQAPPAAAQKLQVPSLAEVCAAYMLSMARQACYQSGSETVMVAKNKEFRFPSDTAFSEYVIPLLATGRCSLTGLHLDATMSDSDLAPSLDRIDSDGHYEPGNLQVVARFVNRWKSDDSIENFRRLLVLVRS
jgi:hypothetical protein